jgi:hypothetical protein
MQEQSETTGVVVQDSNGWAPLVGGARDKWPSAEVRGLLLVDIVGAVTAYPRRVEFHAVAVRDRA